MASSTDILLRVIADTQDAQSGLSSVQKAMGGVTLAVGALGAAFAAFAANSEYLEASAEFEKRMRNINSLAQFGEKDLDNLSKSVMDLSNELQTASATELAASLYDIQSAGFSGAEGMQVLEAATKAAAGGQADSTSVTNALVKALNSYGAEANQAGHFTNVFQKTVAEGIITAEQLSGVIGNATGLASSLGVNIEEVSAAIALMTKKGVSAETAVTNLNGIFTSFLKPSKEAKETMAEFGIEINAQTIKADGLEGTLKKLMKATDGNQEAMAKVLPNVRALQGALKLGGEQGEEFSKQLRAIEDNTGAVDKALQEQGKAFADVSARLGRLIDNLKVEFGDIVKDAVKPFIESIISVIEWFNNLDSGTRKLIAQFVVFAPAVTAIVAGIGSLAIALPGLITAFNGASIAIGGMQLALAPVITGMATIGAAIAGAVGFFVLLDKAADKTSGKLRKLVDSINLVGKVKGYLGLKKQLEDSAKAYENVKKASKAWQKLSKSEDNSVETLTKKYGALQVMASGVKSAGARNKWLKEMKKVRKELNLQIKVREKKEEDAHKAALEDKYRAEQEAVRQEELAALKIKNTKEVTKEKKEATKTRVSSKKKEVDDTEKLEKKALEDKKRRLQQESESYQRASQRKLEIVDREYRNVFQWIDQDVQKNDIALQKKEISRMQYFQKQQQLYNEEKQVLQELINDENASTDARSEARKRLTRVTEKEISAQNAMFEEQFRSINRVIGTVNELGNMMEQSSNKSIQALGTVASAVGETGEKVSGMFDKISKGDVFGAAVEGIKEYGGAVMNSVEQISMYDEVMKDGIITKKEDLEIQEKAMKNIPIIGGALAKVQAKMSGLEDIRKAGGDAGSETKINIKDTQNTFEKGVGALNKILNPFNWFADGGIVHKPTAGIIGERGSEMILNQGQMSNLYRMINTGQVNSKSGSTGVTVNMGNVTVGNKDDLPKLKTMIQQGVEQGLAKAYNNRYY